MAEKLYTPQEVATRLNIHINTVRDMLKEGIIKGFKLNNKNNSRSHWRIRETELEAYIRYQE